MRLRPAAPALEASIASMVSTADTVSGKNRRASLEELIPSSPYGGKGVGKSGGNGKDQSEEPMGKGTVLDKGKKGKGKVKGSKGGAMDGSDNYPREPHYGREGNTDKGGDGGGGKGSSEDSSDESPAATAAAASSVTPTTSHWMHVLTRVKSARANTEAALGILERLEKDILDM